MPYPLPPKGIRHLLSITTYFEGFDLLTIFSATPVPPLPPKGVQGVMVVMVVMGVEGVRMQVRKMVMGSAGQREVRVVNVAAVLDNGVNN